MSQQDLSHAWIGYKAAHTLAWFLKPVSHGALTLLGCPKEQRRDFDDALVDWVLAYQNVELSDKFGGYHNLKQHLNQTSSPWATLFKDFKRRIVYNAHLMQAPLTLFPYVKGLETGHPEVTNMLSSSPKWKNRTLLPFLPLQVLSGSFFFLYDLAMLAATEPSTIKGAFDRRAEQDGIHGLSDYLKSDLREILSNELFSDLRLAESISHPDLESKYELCKEAILKFWKGDNSWEEVLDIWKQRMKDEGISWDDIAIQLKTKRHQMATAANDHLPIFLTDKERNIKRLLNFSILILSLGSTLGIAIV